MQHTDRVSRAVKTVAVIASLIVLGAASSAHAIDYTDPDPRGDVEGWNYKPDPPPCGTTEAVEPADARKGDIRRLSVRDDDGLLRLRLRFRDLPALRRLYVEFPVRTRDRDYMIHLFRARKRTHVHLFPEVPLPDPEPGAECSAVLGDAGVKFCKGLSGAFSPRKNRVRVRLPISCVRSPRWVRVGAEAGYYKRGASFSDTWAPRGSTPQGSWGHVYGPRLRVGR